MDNYIVGIDVSASKVCGVVGRIEDDNNVQILGITTSKCNAVKNGVVVDINSASYAVSDVVKSLENIVDMPLKDAYISMPISLCELTRNRGNIVVSSDGKVQISDVKDVLQTAKLLPVEGHKEVIAIEPEMFIVDGMSNISDPIGMKGNQLQVEAQVVLAQSSTIESYIKSVAKAGIKVNGIVVNSLGIYKDILREEEIDSGVVLVDVGTDTVEVSVYKNNKVLNVFSIGLGGETITNDISICLKVPREDAESLKIKCSNLIKDSSLQNYRIRINSVTGKGAIDISYDTLVDIISERVKELLNIIKKKIIQDGNYKDINSFVIVGGGIALFRDITTVASSIFEKPTRVGSPSYVGAANPIYSTATGIIKQVVVSKRFDDEITEKIEGSDILTRTTHKSRDKIGFSTKIKEFFAELF
jgi:cell division protein FtsA